MNENNAINNYEVVWYEESDGKHYRSKGYAPGSTYAECMACLVDYYGEQFICSVYIEMNEAGPLELSYEEIKH